MENKIAVLDCDSMIFSIINGNKILDDSGNPLRTEDGKRFLYQDKTEEELIDSCKWIMNDVLIPSKASQYVGFLKGKDTVKSKKEVNPDYKADRKTGSLPHGYLFAQDYLINNYNVFKVDNLEVDDAVNIYRLAVADSFICAIDSDLLALEGTHYNWRKKEWVTTTREEARNIFWQNMITGTHNATKGIPGKGIKFAEKCLEEAMFTGYTLPSIVLINYINHFEESEGINQFYSNYVCTKILEKSNNFDVTNYPLKRVMSIFD